MHAAASARPPFPHSCLNAREQPWAGGGDRGGGGSAAWGLEQEAPLLARGATWDQREGVLQGKLAEVTLKALCGLVLGLLSR